MKLTFCLWSFEKFHRIDLKKKLFVQWVQLVKQEVKRQEIM